MIIFIVVAFPTYSCLSDYITFQQANQGEALYIIYSAGIAYHQHAVLHLIKPQVIQPSADDMPSLRLG